MHGYGYLAGVGAGSPGVTPGLPLQFPIHASLLTPYVETIEHSPNYSQPPPDLVGGEEQYEVKAIRNH
jgi:hypothetical protein